MKKILLMLVALVATVWQVSIPQLLAMVPCMPAQLTTRHFRLQASPLLTPKVCSLHVLSSMTRMAMRNGLSASLVNVKSMQ